MPQITRESNRFRPTLNHLDDRTLPSAVAMPFGAAQTAVVNHAHHGLAGLSHGEFHRPAGIVVDGGITDTFHGWGVTADLGRVSVEGSVTGVGFIATGKATGTLTIANASGSVTVALDGPLQPGFSELPHYFHYHVIAGTGDFAHFHDDGTLRLDFYLDASAAPGTPAHGSFRLAI